MGLEQQYYISEFCGPRLKESLKITIELLAAIPSVVWGFIGLTVMSKVIVAVTGAPIGVNLLNGSIMLALMSVPIIVRSVKMLLKLFRTLSVKLACARRNEMADYL